MKLRRFLILGGIAAAVLAIAPVLYFSGRWIPNEPSRAEYPMRGIDVSHHQGEIQWDKVAASGIRFAYIKATEGSDYVDPNFKANWDGAAASHIVRGAYHFFTLTSPGKLQAEHFLSQLPADSGDALPPAIDIELSAANFQNELSDFIMTVEARLGKPPVIYSSSDFKRQYLQGVTVKSWWGSDVVSKPGEPWSFWQYSWRGRVAGIKGFVDLDVLNGSEMAGSEPTPPAR